MGMAAIDANSCQRSQSSTPWTEPIAMYAHDMSLTPQQGIPTFIRRAMPNASQAELHDAADAFRRYVAIVVRMYARVRRESPTVDSPTPDL